MGTSRRAPKATAGANRLRIPGRRAQRQTQAAAYQFYKDWNGPNFPRMIHVLIQHPTPYFDDSYAVNSANHGPYGDAITKDLLPMIEQQFRGIGQGWARVMTGGSTGGWEAFGVQVFYPDDYNGAWALCPDPVDFRSYRSVNIYDEKNAYYYYEDNPFKRTPKPGFRDFRDHLYSTFEERNLVELVLGTHGRSAGQHDAWASVFGPVGADGYYKPLYDKLTGAIDREVAIYWRDHYDLRYILQRDWATLGPKLRGKIHITSGTMDNGYLNNAVYQMEEFLGRATPSAEAGNHVRRAARALLHGRHRASEQRRQPHGASALYAGDGAVDQEDGAGRRGRQELGVLGRRRG